VIIEYCSLQIDVEYTYKEGYAGDFDNGQQISPEEPEEIEIEQVMLGDQCLDELLTGEQRDEISKRILERLKEDEREARLEAELEKAEARRER